MKRGGMIAVVACLLVVLAIEASGEGWKAGVARRSITPTEPVWMAGYAARNKPSEGKLNELWAKAVAVEDPEGRVGLLITLDLCGIGAELSNPVRDKIEREHGLSRSQVVLACSHTHSGPVVGANLIGMYPMKEQHAAVAAAYAEKLAEAIVGVAAEALEAREPAVIAWGVGQCGFAVNRRENEQPKADELRAKLALKGPVDHDVPVLKVSSAEGKTKAIVTLYACHCTTLQGYELSGDYAGFAQEAIEAANPGATALFLAGCGGDQNPLPRGEISQAKRYGTALALAVQRVVDGGMTQVKGKLTTAYQEVDLAFGEIPTRAAWVTEAGSENLAVKNRATAMLAKLDAGQAIETTYPYPVEVWKLGDELRWVFLGGEATVEYALRLKRNLGASKTFVAAYCNDVMAYIPSLKVLNEGGYEGGGAMVYYGLPAAWSSQVEEQVVGAVAELVRAVEER